MSYKLSCKPQVLYILTKYMHAYIHTPLEANTTFTEVKDRRKEGAPLLSKMSTFGQLFRVSTFGESHGTSVGCVVEGVPPGMKLEEDDIQAQLNRRRPGQSCLTTPRQELDLVEIHSGVEAGITLGTPIMLMVRNKDQKKFDYSNTSLIPRPGHADYTYHVKYNGTKASSGGGRASARETIGRVAAGAIAEKWLHETYGVKIACWVSSVGNIEVPNEVEERLRMNPPTRGQIETLGTVQLTDGPLTDVSTRCPHPETAQEMVKFIQQIKAEGDSAGGIVTCCVTGVPIGLGEPVFDKLEAELAKAMMSLPATKGFEIGEGFKGTRMRGSVHNDRFCHVANDNSQKDILLTTRTNHAGGTLGGISNGQDLIFRVAFKPVSSICIAQDTCNYSGEESVLEVKGRHDPCVLPRTPPLVESMAALVLADMCLKQRSRSCPKDLLTIKQKSFINGNNCSTKVLKDNSILRL